MNLEFRERNDICSSNINVEEIVNMDISLFLRYANFESEYEKLCQKTN